MAAAMAAAMVMAAMAATEAVHTEAEAMAVCEIYIKNGRKQRSWWQWQQWWQKP